MLCFMKCFVNRKLVGLFPFVVNVLLEFFLTILNLMDQ